MKHAQSLTRVVAMVLSVGLAVLFVLPAAVLAQTPGTTLTPGATEGATQAPTEAATPGAGTPTAAPTASPNASLSLSSSSGLPGASITANGGGFQDGETVDVTLNGQNVGSPTASGEGTFSLSFTVPQLAPGQYAVAATGRGSGRTAVTSFTLTEGGAMLTFNPTEATPGASLTVNGTGFRAGEQVTLAFNGPTVGTATADTNGNVEWMFTVPATLGPGQFGVTATGESSGTVVNATYQLVVAPSTTPEPVPTPGPGATPEPNAPPMVHDERYFSQTGFRVDNDEIWNFFQQFGGIETFGYPTSRMMTFLGCPVQMFQRQIIQICQGQGAALINMLDPEIFPYTNVNGSTFPAPDNTMKNNTPQVGSPTYSADINNFVQQNVPDTFGGRQVNFQQHFNTTGGLTIWGAPISQPAPDPANANFVYQRFQRGIMHYIQGTGTESILLADYFKGILMGQNVPPDLEAQAQESKFWQQYCPGQAGWLCRPNDVPATDLTNAFVSG